MGSLPDLRGSKVEVKVCVLKNSTEQPGLRPCHSLASWSSMVFQPRPCVLLHIGGLGQDLSQEVSSSLKSSSSIGSTQARIGP